jgi:hypothetical protein
MRTKIGILIRKMVSKLSEKYSKDMKIRDVMKMRYITIIRPIITTNT